MSIEKKTMRIPVPTGLMLGLCATFLLTGWGNTQTAGPMGAIEVPVLVHDQNVFVDDLSLDDFEIYEDGVYQIPSRLFLIQGQDIVRTDERVPAFPPYVGRNIYILIQTTDWDTRLADAIDYLFTSVLLPGDSLTIVTPMKPYVLTQEALAKTSKAELAKNMQQILRKDVQLGSGEYRGLIRDLRRLTSSMGGRSDTMDADLETDTSSGDFGLEQQLDRYRTTLTKLETLRLVDETKLLDLAATLRNTRGRKIIYFFYQREFRPEISSGTMNQLISLNQDNPDILGNLMELFNFYRRDTTLHPDVINKAFADASLVLDFIYMNKEAQHFFGATMREQSEDVFQAFTKIAQATGGISDTSQNPAASFQKAVSRWGKYYLLNYVPTAPERDGSFRRIEVRVKGKNYQIFNRLGYYAK